MLARCVADSGLDLGLPPAGAVYTEATVFHLQRGSCYLIWGLTVHEGSLDALVWDNTGRPNWLPIGLFDIPEQPIPTHWEFRIVRTASLQAQGYRAILGYPQLVRDLGHLDGLADRVPKDLDDFFTQVAKYALDNGLRSFVASADIDRPIQFSELLQAVGAQLQRTTEDPALITPTAKTIQLLLEQGTLIVGDLVSQEDGSVSVDPWPLSPSRISERIQRDWLELDEPKEINSICWLELSS